jgi:hypothetical protein
MKMIPILVAVLVLAGSAARAESSKTFVGVITDTMCTTNHKPMKVSPDERCVRECVRDARTHRYALTDGKSTYILSDQETPAKFAGKKVKIVGLLYVKTNILRVDRIDAK